MAFSTTVVILTVIRTLSALVSAKAAHVRSTLYSMLLRDGEHFPYPYLNTVLFTLQESYIICKHWTTFNFLLSQLEIALLPL